jgi:23S rRNA pseudouridine955/2504/2580 synthase/23S rRNA pseudouridine1911/1915/1917 synthase
LPSPALTILFRDEHYVAIDKPAGLAAIPGRAESTSAIEQVATLLSLPARGSADPRVRVVHRLDKDTSGVLLFALHAAAQRHVSHQFQNNTVTKEYLALVSGAPREDEGEIDAPLAPHQTARERMTVFRFGRPARTRWKIEQRFRSAALLRVFPRTGKTHQIRVHLAHVGFPLLIDPLYNPAPASQAGGLYLSTFKRGYRPAADRDERPLIARLTLHAHRLTFVHLDGSPRTLETPPPKDFRAAVQALAKFGT